MFPWGDPARFRVHLRTGWLGRSGRTRPCTGPNRRSFLHYGMQDVCSTFWTTWLESSPNLLLCGGIPLYLRYFSRYFWLLLEALWAILGNNPYLAHMMYIPCTDGRCCSGVLLMRAVYSGVDYIILKVLYSQVSFKDTMVVCFSMPF